MAKRRKSASEPNRSAASDARSDKPERRPTPRKRTDAPAKAPRPGKIERVADAGLSPKPDVSGAVKTRRVHAAPSWKASATKTADPSTSDSLEAVGRKEEKPRKRAADGKKRRRKWPFVVVGAVLAIVIATVGLLSWDRWYRYDDAAEIQGEWQVHGSTGVVVIDGQSIKLTEDVTWSYKLDADSKTLSYTFGTMEGQGRYRFSLDRNQLVIMDGSGYTWLSTLLDDIAWMADQSLRVLQGQGAEEVATDDGTIVVDRLSRDGSALPRAGAAAAPEPAPAPETAEPSETPAAPETQEAPEAPETPEAGGNGADEGAAEPAATPNAPDATDAGGSVPSPGAAFDVSDRSA